MGPGRWHLDLLQDPQTQRRQAGSEPSVPLPLPLGLPLPLDYSPPRRSVSALHMRRGTESSTRMAETG
jgi:hypothetical protein